MITESQTFFAEMNSLSTSKALHAVCVCVCRLRWHEFCHVSNFTKATTNISGMCLWLCLCLCAWKFQQCYRIFTTQFTYIIIPRNGSLSLCVCVWAREPLYLRKLREKNNIYSGKWKFIINIIIYCVYPCWSKENQPGNGFHCLWSADVRNLSQFIW